MGRYRIMIVDDEQEVRQAMIRKLDWEALGFQVVLEAENGQDALEKAESVPLDVVLTDIKMPFMDGFTMGKHLMRTHPGVKLIIFSGFDEFQYAKELNLARLPEGGHARATAVLACPGQLR